jgi:hypothetical protein
MSSVGVDTHSVAGQPGLGARALIVLAMLAAVGFVVLAALPYFTFLYADAPNQFVDEVRFGRWIFGAGLLGLSLAWTVTTGLAFASIRRSLIEQHKEWMLRSCVVTFAFVTFRIGDVTMQVVGIGEPLQNIAFLSWASWTLPLLVTEAILQGRKIFAVAR